MSQSPPAPLRFPPVDGLTVRAEFDGGAMSSDVGPLIRRGVDPQIGLTTRLAEAIDDQRHPADITPPRCALIAQRIFQIGGGYKDGNDANARRTDPLFKLGLDRRPLGRAMDLASGPTFSRLENAVSTKEIDRMALALADGHTDVLFGLAGHRGLSPRAKPLLDANRQRQGVRDTNARRLNPPLPARPRSDHAWEYPAGTWPPAFRVILKAEGMTFDDTPPRCVVTSLDRPSPACLDRNLYCARGQDDNCIQMLKNDLASDRTADHRFLAHHRRLFLACTTRGAPKCSSTLNWPKRSRPR